MDLGESDRILTLYTRSYGKVKVLAKGVRKPASRKAGYVELFLQIDALIARGQSLDVLTQVDTVEAYLPVRTDLVRTTYASHFVELLDAFTEEGDASPQMFDLLAKGLGWLSTTGDLRRTARYYELALLDLAGYRPQLHRCVACGEKARPENQFYSVRAGGVICPDCGREQPHARPLSLKTLKVLRYLQSRPFDVVEQLTLSPGVHRESERLLHETLAYHLERRLRSVAFLERLRREAAALNRERDETDDQDEGDGVPGAPGPEAPSG
jgi:DNA repair protein RecO (recombination protein O)